MRSSDNTKRFLLIIVCALPLLTACGGGGGGGGSGGTPETGGNLSSRSSSSSSSGGQGPAIPDGGSTAPIGSLTGNWTIVEIVGPNDCEDPVGDIGFRSAAITSDDGGITATLPGGELTGSLDDNELRLSGDLNEGVGVSDISLAFTVLPEGNAAGGVSMFDYSEDGFSCNGENLVGALRTEKTDGGAGATADIAGNWEITLTDGENTCDDPVGTEQTFDATVTRLGRDIYIDTPQFSFTGQIFENTVLFWGPNPEDGGTTTTIGGFTLNADSDSLAGIGGFAFVESGFECTGEFTLTGSAASGGSSSSAGSSSSDSTSSNSSSTSGGTSSSTSSSPSSTGSSSSSSSSSTSSSSSDGSSSSAPGSSSSSTSSGSTSSSSASPSPPAAPSEPQVSNITISSALLSWVDNSTNETEFQIATCTLVSTSSGCVQFNVIDTVGANTTEYEFTSLNEDAEYTYYVRAANSAGTSSAIEFQFSTLAGSTTELVYATFDNTLIASSTEPARADTVYAGGDISVGCNWVYSSVTGIQDYACGATALYFNIDTLIAGRTINNATLQLYPYILPADINDTYEVVAFAGAWDPNAITWDNAPNYYLSPAVEKLPPVTTALPMEFDITAIVQDWADGSRSNFGVLVRNTSYTYPYSTVLRATSFESTNTTGGVKQPQLQITME